MSHIVNQRCQAITAEKIFSPERNKIILINTMPKSGSVYIWSVLTSNYNYSMARISLDRFHDDYIQEEWIKKLFSKKCIAQEHLDASEENVRILEKYFSKMVLNVRDPRQQLISWFHMLDIDQTKGYKLWSDDICPPTVYFQWNREKKYDWLIENFLPASVNWLQGWCDVIDNNSKINILVTCFRDLKNRPDQFFDNIANFYGLTNKNLSQPGFIADKKLHQRKGDIDEWKNELNNDQIKRINELIPEELLKRFGWSQYS